jgi:excisionase family DNA binding protein
MEPILIGKKQAAQLLAISLRSIDNLISRKELRTRRIGRRCLIEWRELLRFARRDHVNRTEIHVGNTAEHGKSDCGERHTPTA